MTHAAASVYDEGHDRSDRDRDDVAVAEVDGGDPGIGTTEASATLPIPAALAFELFADASEIPAWLSVVQSARVLLRDGAHRPAHVAFLAQLDRASIGYSLHYTYDAAALVITWRTGPGSTIQLSGRARFTALGEHASMIHYAITVALPAMAPWEDERFADHAATAVVTGFRDYVKRPR
jgi:uncharacterized membrane protein